MLFTTTISFRVNTSDKIKSQLVQNDAEGKTTILINRIGLLTLLKRMIRRFFGFLFCNIKEEYCTLLIRPVNTKGWQGLHKIPHTGEVAICLGKCCWCPTVTRLSRLEMEISHCQYLEDFEFCIGISGLLSLFALSLSRPEMNRSIRLCKCCVKYSVFLLQPLFLTGRNESLPFVIVFLPGYAMSTISKRFFRNQTTHVCFCTVGALFNFWYKP